MTDVTHDRTRLTAAELDAERCRHPQPVHHFFGLSYANYFVVARSVLEAMPHEWQREFVALMDELNERYNTSALRYVVQLPGDHGRFVHDDLAYYRHSSAQTVERLFTKHSS